MDPVHHNRNFYDITFFERYGPQIISLAFLLIAIATITSLSLLLKNVTKYEAYIDKYGRKASRLTGKFEGYVAGIAVGSAVAFFSLWATIALGVYSRDHLERDLHPKTLTDVEIDELNSLELTLDRAHGILCNENRWRRREANIGPAVRASRLTPGDLEFISLVEQYHEQQLIASSGYYFQWQRMRAENEIGRIRAEWATIHHR